MLVIPVCYHKPLIHQDHLFLFSFFEGYVEILFGDGRVIRKYMHAVMIGRSLLLFFPAGRRVFSKPFQKAIEFPNGLAIIIS